jgi:trehalose-phosphatase
VTFVTGRSIEDGRRMIRLDGASFVGTHGLETMTADGSVVTDPQAERYVGVIHDVLEAAEREFRDETSGVVLEDKRTVLAIHYRMAADPGATRHRILTRVIEPARERGLAIATGHFVFEVRPPLPFTKGIAVRRLLGAGDYFSAVACGDDLTDVTMFAAVRDWGERDARRRTLTVAAVTDETPRPVTEAADTLVRATPGVHEVLSRLAKAAGA